MAERKRFPVKWSWPNNARMAFNIGVPFEGFEMRSQISFSGGRAGERDPFSISYADYGWKAGIWRLLNIIDGYGLKVSVSANGKAADEHAEIIKMMSDDGHEINGHGWANDLRPKDKGPEAERADIQRCMEVITRTTGGKRPVGWTSPGSSGSEDTPAILAKEGFLWYGDDASNDIPFIEETKNGPLVFMPRVNMFMNDITVWIMPQNPTSVFVENFKNTVDQLYREGGEGYPKWMGMTLHSQMAGRPTFSNAIRECLDYVMRLDGIWYAKNHEIAEWTIERKA